jgi:isoquinoline 1-oxidoreductase beta subunit
MIHHRLQPLDPDLGRCGILIRSEVVDGGLMLSVALPIGGAENADDSGFSPGAFIRIDSDGRVFLTWPYLEAEEDNERALIPLLIAQELEVSPNQIHLKQVGPSKRTGSKAMLGERAGGSSNAIGSILKPLREASATARAMLIAAAARRWDVDARLCHAHEGEVIHTTTWQKLRYGELAAEAARIPIPKRVALKEPAATALRRD